MIKPIALNILVEDIKETSKMNGMLVSSKDVENSRHKKAKVVAVGNDVPNIKEGDIIFYDTSRSFTRYNDDKKLTFITYREVLAVV